MNKKNERVLEDVETVQVKTEGRVLLLGLTILGLGLMALVALVIILALTSQPIPSEIIGLITGLFGLIAGAITKSKKN